MEESPVLKVNYIRALIGIGNLEHQGVASRIDDTEILVPLAWEFGCRRLLYSEVDCRNPAGILD
jgi:hypothetical protein